MDYEKKYKDALERARELQHDNCWVTTIFPELRESEDEKIRKELIEYFKHYSGGDNVSIKFPEWIAWLEKQGEQKSTLRIDNSKAKVVFPFKAKVKSTGIVVTIHDGQLSIDGKEWTKYQSDNEDGYKVYEPEDLEYVCNVEPNPVWLEKQGEQKQDPCKACDFPKLNCENFPCINKKAFEQEKSVFDATNEPKFKVGDWIKHNVANFVFQVTSVGSHGYEVVNRENYTQTISFDNEDNYHLWTIQDAKDGDVLANGEMIVIFKHFEEPSYRQHIVAYIGLDISGKIQITDYTWNLGIDKAKPATKEQRDLLFQKMREAGYEWDIKKKELNLLITNGGDFESENCEQKPAEYHREDEQNLNACLGFIPDAYLCRWLKDIIHAKYDNPAWSDVDEADLNNIIWLCNNCIRKCEDTWLPSQAIRIKSLIERIKDTVFLQPKQQWSEDDEKTLNRIRAIVKNDNSSRVEDILWLKSIKKRIKL